MHDVNIGREGIKLEPEKTVAGPRVSAPSSHQPAPGNQSQARQSSLPQNNVPRSTIYGYVGHKTGPDTGQGTGTGGKDDYDEIDQIYDYVRGFAPLPKSAKGWQFIAETVQEEKKEPIYQKLASHPDAENKPPEPPPIDTIPGRRMSTAASPMEVTQGTPPMTPPWASPAHGPPLLTPLGPNGQLIGIVPPPHLVMERPVSADPGPVKFEKASESKKRHRPKTADPGKAAEDVKDTPNSRYVKASNKQNSTKHKFFRSRVKEKDKESAPPPMCNLSSSTFYKDSRQPSHHGTGHPSFFNLRYKSLTNLAHQVNILYFCMLIRKITCYFLRNMTLWTQATLGGKPLSTVQGPEMFLRREVVNLNDPKV